jgi:hypothetical protein
MTALVLLDQWIGSTLFLSSWRGFFMSAMAVCFRTLSACQDDSERSIFDIIEKRSDILNVRGTRSPVYKPVQRRTNG